jgi:two-component system, cell cycle sensor histidine kinase and response regulator CckA
MSRALPVQSTVLVVDHEVQLRRYMARVMADEGYRVLTAADGIEALALLESSDSRVDLVITDVVMPVMTGPELAAHLATQPLPPPVLFVSGGHSLKDVPGPTLRKPFLPGDLTTLVHSLIRGGTEITLGLLE